MVEPARGEVALRTSATEGACLKRTPRPSKLTLTHPVVRLPKTSRRPEPPGGEVSVAEVGQSHCHE